MEKLLLMLAEAGYQLDKKTVELLINFKVLTHRDPSVMDFLSDVYQFADAVTIESLLEMRPLPHVSA